MPLPNGYLVAKILPDGANLLPSSVAVFLIDSQPGPLDGTHQCRICDAVLLNHLATVYPMNIVAFRPSCNHMVHLACAMIAHIDPCHCVYVCSEYYVASVLLK